MPWSAEIVEKKNLDNGDLRVKVSYSKEGKGFTEVLTVASASQVRQLIKNTVKRLNDNDIVEQEIETGPVVIEDESEPPPRGPTQEDLDKDEYQRLLSKYKNIQELISLQVINPSDAVVSRTLDDLKKAYKPRFL